MEKKQIDRINELARKKKTVGLTQAELAEQAALRRQYLDDFREGMKQTLDQVYILQENGEYIKLQKKPLKN